MSKNPFASMKVVPLGSSAPPVAAPPRASPHPVFEQLAKLRGRLERARAGEKVAEEAWLHCEHDEGAHCVHAAALEAHSMEVERIARELRSAERLAAEVARVPEVSPLRAGRLLAAAKALVRASREGELLRAPTDELEAAIADAVEERPEEPEEAAPTPREIPHGRRVAVWEAINAYVEACGGDTSKVSPERMEAAVAVEQALRAIAGMPSVPPLLITHATSLEAAEEAVRNFRGGLVNVVVPGAPHVELIDAATASMVSTFQETARALAPGDSVRGVVEGHEGLPERVRDRLAELPRTISLVLLAQADVLSQPRTIEEIGAGEIPLFVQLRNPVVGQRIVLPLDPELYESVDEFAAGVRRRAENALRSTMNPETNSWLCEPGNPCGHCARCTPDAPHSWQESEG